MLCTLSIPSSCGMFVQRLATSIDTRNVRFFTFVFSMKFMKSVVSLRYDFCDLDISCSNESTKGEILSVGTSQPEMIGLYVIFRQSIKHFVVALDTCSSSSGQLVFLMDSSVFLILASVVVGVSYYGLRNRSKLFRGNINIEN